MILGWQMSLLVICEILGLFINTLTVDDKYFLRNRENIPQPIKMHLSKKQEAFSQLFGSFLKAISHFKYFEKRRPS